MFRNADASAPGAPWAQEALSTQVLTVTQLTERIRARLSADPRLQQVAVTGEVTGFKAHSASGHLYFALKDRTSRLACVMFRSQAQRLAFTPQDGMQVLATGYVDVYPAAGLYQLYVQNLYPVGLGLLYARLRELYERLSREGLFDEQRKRPIPRWPRAVGVVTSLDGAALRDIEAVFRRRSPRTPLIVSPAQVQGEGAAASIVLALERIVRWPDVDVVIVARGGGAADELWVFNDERVVRAVAACPRPVVCAVGHETDVTVAELAADRRAPTPSAAAEIAGPDEAAAAAALEQHRLRLRPAMLRHLSGARERFERAARHPALVRPGRWMGHLRQRLDDLVLRGGVAARRAVEKPRLSLVELAGRLSAASPLDVLRRGYALVQQEASGRWVRKASEVSPGERVSVRMLDGALRCLVEARLDVAFARPEAPETARAGEV